MPLRDFSTFKPKRADINCILLNGGIGDHMGSLVAVNYILKTYSWINLLVWVPDYLLEYAKNVLPERAIVRDYTAMKIKYDRNRTTITTEWDGRTSPMKMHSIDYAFFKLCDENPSIDKKNNLKVNFNRVDISNFSLPEKYVVICTGYTVGVREFNAKAVNEIVDWLNSKGYTAVFVGQDSTPTGAKHIINAKFNAEVNYSKGINLINKTSLLQVSKITQGSKAVVGVDCGLLHLAGGTDAPIVAGFTTVRPELRAPIRNNILGHNFYPVVPDSSLKCRFCQSDTNFLYDHDYKNCIYEDLACIPQLTSTKFIESLQKFL